MGHSLLRAPAFQIVVITLLVFLGVVGLRSQGVLEGLEIEAYDWSLRLRSHQLSESPPITLITITDQDIQEVGHWPISDEILATVLTRIQALRPRVIGVDIYRDLAVPPGRAALNQVLERFPQIMMVMKFGKPEQGGISATSHLAGNGSSGIQRYGSGSRWRRQAWVVIFG